MAVIDAHVNGSPCWFELGTTDDVAAKHFYTSLFGWSVVDNPMGPDGVYTMFKLDGRDVASGFKLPPKLLEQGVPPHWHVYFATSNVDASAAKVTELGGSLFQPPFDVAEHGRMSICKDPEGAVFSLWQPKQQPGVGVFGENNAVCWAELMTPDAPRMRDFYVGLFGWEFTPSANMPTYLEFSVKGEPRGGVLGMDDTMKGVPAHWGIYFMVADCDAAVAKAIELGAKVRFGPISAPGVGRFASMIDPQGAGFSIIKLG